MGFANYILALHRDIHEVYIIEEKDGSYEVVDETSRTGLRLLADRISHASEEGLSAPIIILGAATQLGGKKSKLVGIKYENAGLILAPLTEKKLLLLSTKLESHNDVMSNITAALPQLQFVEITPPSDP